MNSISKMPGKALRYLTMFFTMLSQTALASEEMEEVGNCTLNGRKVPCDEMFSAMAPFILFFVLLFVFLFICQWKIFTKAGKPGWAALIPIYNTLVMLDIIGRPWWWLFLMFIPPVGLVLGIIALHRLSRSFGKDIGYTLGLLFLPVIFMPMLAFGSAKYEKLPDARA